LIWFLPAIERPTIVPHPAPPSAAPQANGTVGTSAVLPMGFILLLQKNANRSRHNPFSTDSHSKPYLSPHRSLVKQN
jgi:hypothetical protein